MAYKHGLIILEKYKEPDKFRGSKTHKKCYSIIHQSRHFRTSAAEGFFIKKSLYRKKWLLCCSYNPDSNNIKNQLSAIFVNLDIYSSQYESFINLGNFNMEVENRDMEGFCKNYNLKSLI